MTARVGPKRDLIVSARIPRTLRPAVLAAARRRAGKGVRVTFNEAVNVALSEYVARRKS